MSRTAPQVRLATGLLVVVALTGLAACKKSGSSGTGSATTNAPAPGVPAAAAR